MRACWSLWEKFNNLNAWNDKIYYFCLHTYRNSRIFLLSFANIGDRIMWSALQSKLKGRKWWRKLLSKHIPNFINLYFFSRSFSTCSFPVYIQRRYNYKVNDVFREIMGVSGLSGCSGVEFSQSSRHKSKCNIL